MCANSLWVKLLFKQEFRILQNQISAKDETLCRAGPKGNTGQRERPGIRGRSDPPGRTGPQGPPGKHRPLRPQGPAGIRGISECRVSLVPRDLEAHRAWKVLKVSRASPSRLLLCCSLLLKQQSMKVRRPSWNVQRGLSWPHRFLLDVTW